MSAAVVHTCARLPFQNALRSGVYSTSRRRYLSFCCLYSPYLETVIGVLRTFTLGTQMQLEKSVSNRRGQLFVALGKWMSPYPHHTSSKHRHNTTIQGGEGRLNQLITICKCCWRCINSTAFRDLHCLISQPDLFSRQ